MSFSLKITIDEKQRVCYSKQDLIIYDKNYDICYDDGWAYEIVNVLLGENVCKAQKIMYVDISVEYNDFSQSKAPFKNMKLTLKQDGNYIFHDIQVGSWEFKQHGDYMHSLFPLKDIGYFCIVHDIGASEDSISNTLVLVLTGEKQKL